MVFVPEASQQLLTILKFYQLIVAFQIQIVRVSWYRWRFFAYIHLCQCSARKRFKLLVLLIQAHRFIFHIWLGFLVCVPCFLGFENSTLFTRNTFVALLPKSIQGYYKTWYGASGIAASGLDWFRLLVQNYKTHNHLDPFLEYGLYGTQSTKKFLKVWKWSHPELVVESRTSIRLTCHLVDITHKDKTNAYDADMRIFFIWDYLNLSVYGRWIYRIWPWGPDFLLEKGPVGVKMSVDIWLQLEVKSQCLVDKYRWMWCQWWLNDLKGKSDYP